MSPQEKNVQEIYTERIGLYHNVFDTILRYRYGIEAFYKKQDYIRPDMKILDAGCGSGNQTIAIHNTSKLKCVEGIQYNGFDITPAMLEGLGTIKLERIIIFSGFFPNFFFVYFANINIFCQLIPLDGNNFYNCENI